LKRRIVLLGPPASGKGTQAELVAHRFGMLHVSTGAILREERNRGTDLGKEAARWTSQGLLFPDALALDVVECYLDVHGWDAFILDGFPRTAGQARAFDARLSSREAMIDRVFSLCLPDEEIKRRVLDRITCTRCGATFSRGLDEVSDGDACRICGARLERRGDDTLAALERRLAQHRQLTDPVIDYYQQSVGVTVLDAMRTRDEIFSTLCELLEERSVV